jgi:hypothetical protein
MRLRDMSELSAPLYPNDRSVFLKRGNSIRKVGDKQLKIQEKPVNW